MALSRSLIWYIVVWQKTEVQIIYEKKGKKEKDIKDQCQPKIRFPLL